MYLTSESGLSFNVPLKQYVNLNQIEGWPYTEMNRKFYSTHDFYSKVTFESRIRNRNNYSLHFVSGISFIENKIIYRDSGYFSSCWYRSKVNDTVFIETKNIMFSAGTMIRKTSNKFELSISILLNPMLELYSKTSKYSFITNYNTIEKSNSTELKLYLSSQLSLQYRLSRNFSIGPTCEFFTCNLLNIKNIHNLNKNILINPGLKLNVRIK